MCRYEEFKCKHCSGGKKFKTTESGDRVYQRVAPDCSIPYQNGRYAVCDRITVNAKKPTMSSISDTSSHSSNKSQVFDWLFARLNL